MKGLTYLGILSLFTTSLFIWGIGDGTQKVLLILIRYFVTNPVLITFISHLKNLTSLFIVHGCKKTQLCMLSFAMCVCMYVHVCVNTGVHACRSQRSNSGAIPHEPSTLITETRLWLNYWPAIPRNLSVSVFLVLGIQTHATIPRFFTWNLETELRSWC